MSSSSLAPARGDEAGRRAHRDAGESPDTVPPQPGRIARAAAAGERLWALPLWVHAAALAAVLALAAWASGTPGEFSVDEGLAIVQAKSLASGGGWHLPLPIPSVDPTGLSFPYPRHSATFATYAKHPLYPVLLSLCDRVGGVWAMVGLSLLGTVAAAWLAALLADRLRPRLGRWVLWAVGLASPLLFDGLTVFAHSLAAALATLVVLAALAHRRTGRWWWVPVAALAADSAIMLRTEAILLLGLVAFALVAVGSWRREGRPLVMGLVVAAAMLLARVVDQAWAAAVGGGGVNLADGGGHDPLAALHAVPTTLLGPSLGPPTDAGGRLLLLATLGVFAGSLAIRARQAAGPAKFAWVVGVTATAGAVAVGRPIAVPGLLVVCPCLVAGLVMFPWRRADDELRAMAVILGGFLLVVLLTQYSVGGSLEWGARYLAVGVPLALALAVWSLLEVTERCSASLRRVTATGLVVCSLLLGIMALTSLRRRHDAINTTVRVVAEAAAHAPSDDGGRPVVMTTDEYLPLWRLAGQVRLMRVKPQDVDLWTHRLRSAGMQGFVLFDANGVSVESTG